jgi:hypothetical protein
MYAFCALLFVVLTYVTTQLVQACHFYTSTILATIIVYDIPDAYLHSQAASLHSGHISKIYVVTTWLEFSGYKLPPFVNQ